MLLQEPDGCRNRKVAITGSGWLQLAITGTEWLQLQEQEGYNYRKWMVAITETGWLRFQGVGMNRMGEGTGWLQEQDG